MNLTKRIFIAFDYYRSQRRREKRREARRRKRRCPPAPPPSPASPPPPSPASPPLSRSPANPNKVKRKSDSDYSRNADSKKSDSDFSTPRKRTKLFSDDDAIKILRGLLYMNKNSDKKTWVTDEVVEHINRSLRRNADFTKTQFRRKIRGMKDKYNRNRDKEGKFYKLCAKIWGDNREGQPMNSSSTTDSNVEDSEINNEHQDNEEGNDLIARRAEIKRKSKELDIMTLELSLKRLAVMKETIDAVLEVLIQ